MRALIFDFDGVLVDAEPIHCQVWMEVLATQHITFTKKDYYERYIGFNDRDFLKKVFSEKGQALTPKIKEELIRQKEARSRESLAKEIPLIEGADVFLKEAFRKYPLALVTGALPGEVYFILDALRWRNFFSIVITSADVKKGKPNPEGFLKAFEKLKRLKSWNPPLQKKECLVFEDSQKGILAAQKAGLPYEIVKGSLKGLEKKLSLW